MMVKAKRIDIRDLPSHCSNCGRQIKVMCFLGTDHCSENCRKDLEKEKNNETNQGK